MTDGEVIAALRDEKDRLMAGLKMIRQVNGLGATKDLIAEAVLEGADVRDPAEAIAVCAGQWREDLATKQSA